MLTSETKNKLNSVKNVLVGKIPDPKGQVDQITNALIYKFMDDQDRLSMGVPGGKASFFVGELEEYAWHKLFDSKLSNQDRADLYIKGLDKLSTATKLPELFRDIFKNAYLPFRAPDTIAMFLDVINTFDYHHPEELGNAFEHLLSIMGSQGDAGQFRTPRHIIEFIVKVVAPRKDETILDPACGTAGFLVEAFNQIKNGSKLTPQELQLLANNIEGFDIDPGMAKLARVNLYLHGFKTPHITENDTLTNENLWLKKKYDVILANPPFMSPKGGIRPHDKFSVKANKSEVLFVNYIAEHLKLHGRAGIIVPEGVIFQSGNAYKQLRKTLIEDSYLSAVVSLPSGVFNPYAGVKTSILILDRERAKNNDEILFVKIESDGYDLGAQRRPISKNDLPEALEVIEKWTKGEKVESKISNFVSKEKIAESDDYNLSGDRYITTVDYGKAKWPMVFVKDVAFFQEGPGILSSQYTDGGYPIVNVRNVQDGYLDLAETKFVNEEIANNKWSHFRIKEEDILFTTSGTIGRVSRVKKENLPLLLNTSVVRFSTLDKNILYSNYLYYSLKSDYFVNELLKLKTGSGQFNVGPTHIKTLKIPLPPLEIQEQIVAELDGYQKIIDGAKQVVENWKPRIDIDSTWKKVKLGDIGKVCMCKRIFKEQTKNEGDIPFYKIGTFGKEPDAYIDKNLFEEYKAKYSYPKNGAILLSTSGTIGRTVVFDGRPAYFQDSNIVWIDNNEKLVTDKYLYYVFQITDWITTKGGTIERLYNKLIEETVISVPSIETQKQIVEKIEAEKLLVESNRKLIEIYEQKMKDVISKLWN